MTAQPSTTISAIPIKAHRIETRDDDDDEEISISSPSQQSEIVTNSEQQKHGDDLYCKFRFQISISFAGTPKEMLIPGLLRFYDAKQNNNTNNEDINNNNNHKSFVKSLQIALPITFNFLLSPEAFLDTISTATNFHDFSRAIIQFQYVSDKSLKISLSSNDGHQVVITPASMTKKLRSTIFPFCGFVLPQTPALTGSPSAIAVLGLSSSSSLITPLISTVVGHHHHHHHNNNQNSNNNNHNNNSVNAPINDTISIGKRSVSNATSHHSSSNTTSVHNHQQQNNNNNTNMITSLLQMWWWMKSDSGCPRHGPFSCTCRTFAAEGFLLTSLAIETEIWKLTSFCHQEKEATEENATKKSKLASLNSRRKHHQQQHRTAAASEFDQLQQNGDEMKNRNTQVNPIEMNLLCSDLINNLVSHRILVPPVSSNTTPSSIQQQESINDDDQQHFASQNPINDVPFLDLSAVPKENQKNLSREIVEYYSSSLATLQKQQQQQPFSSFSSAFPPFVAVLHRNVASSVFLSVFALTTIPNISLLLSAHQNEEITYVPHSTTLLVKISSSSSSPNAENQQQLFVLQRNCLKLVEHALLSLEEGILAAQDFCNFYFSTQFLWRAQVLKKLTNPSSNNSKSSQTTNNNNDENADAAVGTLPTENLVPLHLQKCSWCNLLCQRVWPGKNLMLVASSTTSSPNQNKNSKQMSTVRNCADCNRELCGCPDTGCDHRCCMCDQPVCGMCSRKINAGDEDEGENSYNKTNQTPNISIETNYLSVLTLVRDVRVCGRCGV